MTEPPAPGPEPVPPPVPPPGEGPGPAPPGPSCPCIPGTLATVNFHFTQAMGGGAAASELRVYGPIGSPFIIRKVWVSPESGVVSGQFIDILTAGDGSTTDTATPSGASIFDLLEGSGSVPGRDAQRALAVPPAPLELEMAIRVDVPGQWIKVRNFFGAPALDLAVVHVTMMIEVLDQPGTAPPAVQLRLPLITIGGTLPTTGLYPAWRVAAQGLEPSRYVDQLRTYTALDSYMAWLLEPQSVRAKFFADRVTAVLEAAGIMGGDETTLVDIRFALPGL